MNQPKVTPNCRRNAMLRLMHNRLADLCSVAWEPVLPKLCFASQLKAARFARRTDRRARKTGLSYKCRFIDDSSHQYRPRACGAS